MKKEDRYKMFLKYPALIGIHRHKIIKMLLKNKELNISQINDKLGVTYRESRRHVLQLEKYGIVKTKHLRISSQPVMVSLK